MEYDEKLANEISQKFNISEKTIRVWKNRGFIPDRYFDGRGKKEKTEMTDAQRFILDRIKACEFINFKYLCSIAEIDSDKLIKSFKDRNSLSDEQFNRVVFHVRTLKCDIKNSLLKNTSLEYKRIMNDKRLHYYLIVTNKIDADRIKRSLNNNSDISRCDVEIFKRCYFDVVKRINV